MESPQERGGLRPDGAAPIHGITAPAYSPFRLSSRSSLSMPAGILATKSMYGTPAIANVGRIGFARSRMTGVFTSSEKWYSRTVHFEPRHASESTLNVCLL